MMRRLTRDKRAPLRQRYQVRESVIEVDLDGSLMVVGLEVPLYG